MVCLTGIEIIRNQRGATEGTTLVPQMEQKGLTRGRLMQQTAYLAV